MGRFLHTGFVALATVLALFTSSHAQADGRIAAGAIIPLDPSKASDPTVLKEIITSCMYEEAMKGMFPELSNIEKASTTVKEVTEKSETEDQRSGSGAAITTTSVWKPDAETSLTFDETLADGTTKQRYLNLGLSVYYDGEMLAQIQTDYKDLGLSDYFTLPYGPAQLQVVSTGGTTCGQNNWGREVCRETPPIVSAVNLVIPDNFVAGANWTNSDTGVETQKRFDFFAYADCILWKWEN